MPNKKDISQKEKLKNIEDITKSSYISNDFKYAILESLKSIKPEEISTPSAITLAETLEYTIESLNMSEHEEIKSICNSVEESIERLSTLKNWVSIKDISKQCLIKCIQIFELGDSPLEAKMREHVDFMLKSQTMEGDHRKKLLEIYKEMLDSEARQEEDKCEAVQLYTQMECKYCNTTWDISDTNPPKCGKLL